jgi:TPR repeat protein
LKCNNEEDGIEMTIQEIQKARNNDNEAYKIGEEYHKKNEYKKAFAWFHKAALQNYPEAQAQVGWIYGLGRGVFTDYKQAMKWSMKAASAGDANGQYQVGFL